MIEVARTNRYVPLRLNAQPTDEAMGAHLMVNPFGEGTRRFPGFVLTELEADSGWAALCPALLRLRKEYIIEQEACLRLQKESGERRDKECARLFGLLAKEALKFKRAVCILLAWFGYADELGDCKPEHESHSNWPLDLLPYVEHVVVRAGAVA